MNDNVEEICEEKYHAFNNNIQSERSPSAAAFSVMLLFVWRRQTMSKAAINDICRLLNAFNIPNMLKDFRGMTSYV